MVSPGVDAPVLEVAEASERNEVLLVHAPYPGRLRFPGIPGSLLAAVAPYVRALAARGEIDRVGLLDPGDSSEAFYGALAGLLGRGHVRAVCISTSTAAIEEAARVARTAKTLDPGILVVLGGPHEDGCPGSALHLPDVDVSMGAGCGEVLKDVLEDFVAWDASPSAFVRELGNRWCWVRAGRSLSSRHWSEPQVRFLEVTPSAALAQRPSVRPSKPVRFDVFGSRVTIPLMVSEGCSYGRCTFCAEGNAKRAVVASDFAWISDLACTQPQASLYFQDSIFPNTDGVKHQLLPLLRQLGRSWGCQVFLPAVSREWLHELRASGCAYLYTGLESASPDILRAVGKRSLSRPLVLERLGWARDEGFHLGLSLMFGAMATTGGLLETEQTLGETEQLSATITDLGVAVAGFYPNIQTVLPGTALARGLARAGYALNFYKMPRSSAFSGMEDGAVGYNFLTLSPPSECGVREVLASAICQTAMRIERMGGKRRDLTERRQSVGADALARSVSGQADQGGLPP